jgi:hypothetical protein
MNKVFSGFLILGIAALFVYGIVEGCFAVQHPDGSVTTPLGNTPPR